MKKLKRIFFYGKELTERKEIFTMIKDKKNTKGVSLCRKMKKHMEVKSY